MSILYLEQYKIRHRGENREHVHLFNEYAPSCSPICRKGSGADAQDVVQVLNQDISDHLLFHGCLDPTLHWKERGQLNLGWLGQSYSNSKTECAVDSRAISSVPKLTWGHWGRRGGRQPYKKWHDRYHVIIISLLQTSPSYKRGVAESSTNSQVSQQLATRKINHEKSNRKMQTTKHLILSLPPRCVRGLWLWK